MQHSRKRATSLANPGAVVSKAHSQTLKQGTAPSILGLGLVPESRAELTYGSFGEERLRLLCQGFGWSVRRIEQAARVFRLMSRSWGKLPLGSSPAWPTDITDDGTPFEFSIAFGDTVPKLRILVEASQAPVTPWSLWRAGLNLNERLWPLPRVDLKRFETVRELFAPVEGINPRFTLWHAAVLDPKRATAYKVYLNPLVRGAREAIEVVTEALSRLRLSAASKFLRDRIPPSRSADLLYFSLDLSNGPDARAKIYIAHPGASAQEIESALHGGRNYRSGDARRWTRRLLGADGPFDRRPILSCLSFTAQEAVPTVTVHVPVRDYTYDDAQSAEAACDFLGREDARAFMGALNRFASRPLRSGRGAITYVSLRRQRRGVAVTVYMSPEAFTPRPRVIGKRVHADAIGPARGHTFQG